MRNFITTFQLCVEFPALVEGGLAVCVDGDDEVAALLVLEGEGEDLSVLEEEGEALLVLDGEEEAVID